MKCAQLYRRCVLASAEYAGKIGEAAWGVARIRHRAGTLEFPLPVEAINMLPTHSQQLRVTITIEVDE